MKLFFTYFYLCHTLYLNICFKLFAVFVNLNSAIHSFHHLNISIVLFLLSSLICLFCLSVSMTLQCVFSDNDQTLLLNNSKYESSVMLINLICLLFYTASSAASAARSAKNILLNWDHYIMHILRDYNLNYIQLLYQFDIFSNLNLLWKVLQTQWIITLNTLLSELN